MQIRFEVSIDNFMKIPGTPIAYWFSLNKFANFGTPTSNVLDCKTGLICGNNERFIRNWFEVNYCSIGFCCHSLHDTGFAKWFPYNHGGEKTKWYGGHNEIVFLRKGGAEMKSVPNSMFRNSDYYFKEGITWNRVGSGIKFAARKACSGFVFDDVSPSGFCTNSRYFYLLAFLNTVVFNDYLRLFCTALKVEIGQIGKVPYKYDSLKDILVIPLAKNNIELSRKDWDSFETSWDFKKHPLI